MSGEHHKGGVQVNELDFTNSQCNDLIMGGHVEPFHRLVMLMCDKRPR